MDSSYINEDAYINTSIQCINDSSIGYSADFSVNGEVDGWEYFDGIHSYGCWGGFLFGTIFKQTTPPTYATIGRTEVFQPVDAETHYFIRIVMKFNPYERDNIVIHPLPTQGKVQWRTLSSPIWDSDKEKYFTLYADSQWHTYIINVGTAQYWVGNINDLRIWPVIENAEDGDEFFIRAIEIFSIASHRCLNTQCEKYLEYSHPCPWIGSRASIKSSSHQEGVSFSIPDDSEFIININGYGNEIVNIPELNNANGQEVANTLAKNISYTDIGGYAEVQVEFTDNREFKIYTGTITSDSSIEIIDNELSKYLGFSTNSEKETGEDPVNGYSPLSGFKIKTHQLYGLFDNNADTQIIFNPLNYSIEGGRRDWLDSSLGIMKSQVGAVDDADASGQIVRNYFTIENSNKTMIDFNHPFNASGRITNIWLQGTVDSSYNRVRVETDRRTKELYGAKVLIIRPKRDGTMEVIYSWDVPDRDANRDYYDKLYSTTEEAIHFDVDVFINKGDFIGVYNVNMYTGKTLSGHEYDSRFYQVDGLVSDIFDPGELHGDGSSGLLMYARGDDTQKRLYIEMDLRNRYNIDNINMYGEAKTSILEYNLARCLDINWKVDLFNLDHFTHHKLITDPFDYHYLRPNVYYGLENLSDGVYIADGGVACDSYSLTLSQGSPGVNSDAGPGVVPVNPKYFWVNGDEEWLGIWLHAGILQYEQTVTDFSEDPIAFYIDWPHGKDKKIYKSKIYFKEKGNFRSFALSTYVGPYYSNGNADDVHYDLIPGYTKVTLDRKEYFIGSGDYENVDKYLFVNPSYGGAILVQEGRTTYEWDPVYSQLREDFGEQGGHTGTGYFVSKTGRIENYDQYEQARNLNWNILEHEWDPIECKGFRFYTDLHQSTKLLEMEIYGSAEDVGSSLAGSIITTYSEYGDIWWPTEISQETENLVNIYVGDSPRYLRFEIIPVTETIYDDIVISVKTEDLFAGSKGCEYVNLIEHSKTNSVNNSQVINLKNVYGAPYDLYVDIKKDVLYDKGVIYFSKLNNALSISDPFIGPDSIYHKLPDYRILNQDYNVAINCPAYGLKNLIDGAKAYYSYDDMLIWNEWGTLNHGAVVGFENLPTGARTIIYLPNISRSRYWKFGLLDGDIEINIEEMKVYDLNGVELDPDYYHDLDKSFIEGGVTYRAPHLENDSIVGSYYTITGNQYITMDLHGSIPIGYIELYHDGILDYVTFTSDTFEEQYAGIDRYTKMCLRAWKDSTGAHLNDVSYFEHEVILHGSTVIDTGMEDSNVSLFVDFGCQTDFNDWYITNDTYGSTFSGTSASGTIISGSCDYEGYVDFNVWCNNSHQEGFFYDIREDSTDSAFKLCQQMPFELTFKIYIDSYTLSSPNPWGPGLSVGVLSSRAPAPGAWFQGAQMTFDPDNGKFGIAVRRAREVSNYSVVDTGAFNHIQGGTLNVGTLYYCKFTCNGALDSHRDSEYITYTAKAWTDGFDGSNKVADITLNSSYYWEAYRVGFGGGAYDPSNSQTGTAQSPASVSGTIYDFKVSVDHDVKHYPFGDDEISEYEKASIRIPAGENNYVRVSTSAQLTLGNRQHTHDIWVKFRSLPEIAERYTIMEQYNYENDTAFNRGWRLALYNTGTWYRLEWWINENGTWTLAEYNGLTGANVFVPNFNIVKDKWYFLMFTTGRTAGGFTRSSFFDINCRAVFDSSYPSNPLTMYDIPGLSDIIIGKNFDGWICEPRISRADQEGEGNHGGQRFKVSYAGPDPWNAPVKPYNRMYSFSFYVSDNNLFFGHYADVDVMFDTEEETYLPNLYNNPLSKFSEKYNSYFAIDFGHRYDIDIVRRYGSYYDHYFSETSNIMYSNIETDDPEVAFKTEPAFDPDDSFEGFAFETVDKDKWYLADGVYSHENTYLRMRNGRLEHIVDSTLPDIRFYSTYGIKGDFDIQVRCGKISAPDSNNWGAIFRIDMSDGENGITAVEARMEYNTDGYVVRGLFYDDGDIAKSDIYESLSSSNTGLRIIRFNNNFTIKYLVGSVWTDLYSTELLIDVFGKDVWRIQFGLVCDTTYPTTRTYWKNFKINSADVLYMRSHIQDARWMIIEMLNGDGSERFLEKIGVYPDISTHIAPGGGYYNTNWDSIGNSLTNYSDSINIALDATVSGSSTFADYILGNITNGIIDNNIRNAWLSDNSTEQWISIDLGAEYSIFRIKIYHGCDTITYSDFYATKYLVQTSTDGISYTTTHSITSNTSFERTHDLAEPVTARYVRIYLEAFTNDGIGIKLQDHDTLEFTKWLGACLREVEVYEYYGWSTISSEEYPIVAVNLKEQFYVADKELVGIYTEDSSYDWDDSDSAFSWSDSVNYDPQKVHFGSYGGSANFEQWVAIKRDTATWHNADPSGDINNPPPGLGVDYLKHIRIQATTKENPIFYPWWWLSNLSTLSRDYDKETILSISSLRIDYPASSSLDTVQFIEGSDWGIDEDIAHRDGLSFRWYIEDIDKLDLSNGTVFFGGTDGTSAARPVVYYWNIATYSGTLTSGWNTPYFRFRLADSVTYNTNATLSEDVYPLMREFTTWHTVGMSFRGKGEAFHMNIDGFVIKRNHFQDASRFDTGLYLANTDYLTSPLGAIDMSSGAIEFWFRPDYNGVGADEFNRIWNRGLFNIGNVANDVFGMVVTSAGFSLYYGNISFDFNILEISGLDDITRDNIYHIAVAFSNNGRNMGLDGSTIKVFLNNIEIASTHETWDVLDNKSFKFTFGSKSPLAVLENTASIKTGGGDAVFSNLRIYNYCKTDYTDSLTNTLTTTISDRLKDPSEMIEISDDNVTFYKVDEAGLPFYFPSVSGGETVPIYVRSIVPDGLTGKEKRTAGIVVQWDIGI